MTAYYNEINPYAAQWLRNLVAKGHIAPGDVDERSIVDVKPEELVGYTQCHFFAGIGVWSHALRRAGWPDSRPVWTGSCPCQPFSSAGKRAGFDDQRHLWPEWFRLIRERQPRHCFGEQVASKDGLSWLDIVLADLDSENYAATAFDLCAAGVGAPHIRQRLYFVAHAKDFGASLGYVRPRRDGNLLVGDTNGTHLERVPGIVPGTQRAESGRSDNGLGGAGTTVDAAGFLAPSDCGGSQERRTCCDGSDECGESGNVRHSTTECSTDGGLAHAHGDRSGTVRRGDEEDCGHSEAELRAKHGSPVPGGSCEACGMAHASECGLDLAGSPREQTRYAAQRNAVSGPTSGDVAHSNEQPLTNRRRGNLLERSGATESATSGEQPDGDSFPGGDPLDAAGFLAHADESERQARGLERCGGGGGSSGQGCCGTSCGGVPVVMGDPNGERLEREQQGSDPKGWENQERQVGLPDGTVRSACNGFWHDAVLIPCRDGKSRPTQPGIFPLAHGATSRVGRLCAYGNAICAPLATEFIRAYLHITAEEGWEPDEVPLNEVDYRSAQFSVWWSHRDHQAEELFGDLF